MNASRNHFQQQGFVHLEKSRANLDLSRIESALAEISQRALSASTDNVPGTVVVTEAGNAEQLCRIEYLAGSSPYYAQELVPCLAQLIEQHLGQPVNLFKDKCNFKHPGGGAFTPHQDITAYRHFASNYRVTAAVLLDAAVEENGALEIATHWDLTPKGAQLVNTPRGSCPSYPAIRGPRNGISTIVSAQPCAGKGSMPPRRRDLVRLLYSPSLQRKPLVLDPAHPVLYFQSG